MQHYDDTALRAAIDLRDAYEATVNLWRDLDAVDGRMVWKTVKGRDYLYHVFGHAGSGKSLGPRSGETESTYESFRAQKARTKEQLADTEPDLKRAAAMYLAAGLPVVDSWAAKLFQSLDRAGVLGQQVMVVGTNAMPAYQLEAQVRTGQRMHATRDTDIAWADSETQDGPVLWPVLREFDPTFTVNSERPFQAIARGSRELELLSAPSRLPALHCEPLRPVPLPEQEWLLMGQPLRHIITGLDRTPTAIVVPDPRWFALHKRWLADKPGRDPLKIPKDRRQAQTLWRWLPGMARYPVDQAFIADLPEELLGARILLDAEVEWPTGASGLGAVAPKRHNT